MGRLIDADDLIEYIKIWDIDLLGNIPRPTRHYQSALP